MRRQSMQNANGPVHRIFISTFAIGKHEVTREHYATFVVATGYHKAGGCKYWTGTEHETVADKDWRYSGYPQ